MIVLYGAVDDSRAAVGTFDEADREELVLFEAGEIPCIGRRASERPRVDQSLQEALLDHDGIIQKLMGACTVVPFRFHTVVSGAEDFHRKLDGRAGEFAELLVWLRARVELAIRAQCGRAMRQEPPGSGRAYLSSRRDQLIPGPLVELHHLLVDSSVAATVRADGASGLKGSYLVERAAVDDFTENARTAASDLHGVTDLSVTGPWAPYSFVTAEWIRQDAHG